MNSAAIAVASPNIGLELCNDQKPSKFLKSGLHLITNHQEDDLECFGLRRRCLMLLQGITMLHVDLGENCISNVATSLQSTQKAETHDIKWAGSPRLSHTIFHFPS